MAAYKEKAEGGYDTLACGIVIQAVKDYEGALKGRKVGEMRKSDVIDEIERFFRSEWYKELTDLDAEYIMKKVRRKVYIWKRKRMLKR